MIKTWYEHDLDHLTTKMFLKLSKEDCNTKPWLFCYIFYSIYL